MNPLGERLGSLDDSRRKASTENISHVHHENIRSLLPKAKDTKQARAFPTGREGTDSMQKQTSKTEL